MANIATIPSMKTFKSPGDFLAHCQEYEKTYCPPHPASDGWLKAHGKQLREMDVPAITASEFLSGYFNDLLELVVNSMTDHDLRTSIRNQVAVGLLESETLTACITKSDDGRHYAILIHSSLVMMLNHYLKLVMAANHNSSVTYCNDLNVGRLGSRDYIDLSIRMLAHYKVHREIRPPELKLRTGSPALALVEGSLHLIYTFLIGHELAHYINGDLAGDDGEGREKWIADQFDAKEDPYHAKEHKADIIGFELLLRLVHAKNPETTVVEVLKKSIILLFNMVREIGDKPSATHPMSSIRICAIIDCFLGRRAADLMFRSFGDLAFLEPYEREYGGVTISTALAQFPRIPMDG